MLSKEEPVTDKRADAPGKCHFYLARKRRNCKFVVVPGHQFCGNHLYVSVTAAEPEADAGGAAAAEGAQPATEQGQAELSRSQQRKQSRAQARLDRVPCPADPRHTVTASQLELHLKKCPAALQAAAKKAAVHYVADINAGSDCDEDATCLQSLTQSLPQAHSPHPTLSETRQQEPQAVNTSTEGPDTGPFAPGRALRRSTVAKALGKEGFLALIRKIQDAYAQECGEVLPPLQELQPACLLRYLDPEEADKMLSANQFAAPNKHARQAVSIVGHMMDFKLLPLTQQQGQDAGDEDSKPATPTTHPSSPSSSCGVVVELGAGKAVLAAMAVATPPALTSIGGAVLVDYRAAFKQKADRWMRHLKLQRITTDLKDLDVHKIHLLQQHIPPPPPTATSGPAGTHTATSEGNTPSKPAAPPIDANLVQQAENKHGRNLKSNNDSGKDPSSQERDGGEGLPQWVVIGKHLCGAATDYSLRATLRYRRSRRSRSPEAAQDRQAAGQSGQDDSQMSTPEQAAAERCQGLAIATCCHHRCGWASYVGKGLFRRLGFSAGEFELISWMTGWALCGHSCAPGCGPEDGDEADGDEQDEQDTQQQQQQQQQHSHKRDRSPSANVDGDITHKAARSTSTPTPDVGGGNAMEGGSAGNAGTACPASMMQGVKADEGNEYGGDGVEAWDPAKGLDRSFKMQVGAMAKMLIDRGRLLWLCDQVALDQPDSQHWSSSGSEGHSRHACVLRYVEETVSGENKLLVAKF